MSNTKAILKQIYRLAHKHFGPQNWWPGETPFEVCLGAILTQNTAWSHVEKAINNIKEAGLLDFERLYRTPDAKIAGLIRPAGYFNIKTKRLRHFLNAVHDRFGSFEALTELAPDKLRETLLSINGIGPETADSMVLYAFHQPSFVIDAYTKRILVRHSLVDEEADYYQLKDLFESHLESEVPLFNEYHALLVMVGKNYCLKSKPRCEHCPLYEVNGGPVL